MLYGAASAGKLPWAPSLDAERLQSGLRNGKVNIDFLFRLFSELGPYAVRYSAKRATCWQKSGLCSAGEYEMQYLEFPWLERLGQDFVIRCGRYVGRLRSRRW